MRLASSVMIRIEMQLLIGKGISLSARRTVGLDARIS